MSWSVVTVWVIRDISWWVLSILEVLVTSCTSQSSGDSELLGSWMGVESLSFEGCWWSSGGSDGFATHVAGRHWTWGGSSTSSPFAGVVSTWHTPLSPCVVGDNIPWWEGVSLLQTLVSVLWGGGVTSPFVLWVSLALHGQGLDEGDLMWVEGRDNAFHSAYSFASEDRAQRYNLV